LLMNHFVVEDRQHVEPLSKRQDLEAGFLLATAQVEYELERR